MQLPRLLAVFVFCQFNHLAFAQQVIDESFSLDITNTAFSSGAGPVVCIDEAHYNFHTIEGNYKAFANLVRSDGYRAIGLNNKFSSDSLSTCDLMVISNAIAEENDIDWSYPHNSAFSREEIEELIKWIDRGGNLLLIADHPPMAGASSGLGATIGLLMTDVYADGNPGGNDIFSKADNTLQQHSILDGRNASESISRLMTFTGQPVQITNQWQPLITFGPAAIAFINPDQIIPETGGEERMTFSIAGWVHAAARELGSGRIVFLGEAAMCSAQLAGPEQFKMGMNHPEATHNAQFCLNTVRWLTRVLL